MIALIFILAVASLDDLAISVPGGGSRQFVFTNKEAGFLTGETSSENTSSYNGWFVQLHKYLEDYDVMLGPDQLGPSSLDSVLVYPDRLVRFYGVHNSRETLTLLDSLNAVSVEIETDYVGEVSIIPRVSFRQIWEVRKADYQVGWDDWLAIQRRDWSNTDFPVILGVKANLETDFEESPHTMSRTYPKDLRRRAMVSDFPFSPGRLVINRRAEKIVLVFAVGKTRTETEEILESVHSELGSMKKRRRARMEELLEESHVQTSNEEYNTALRWAILSLDALVMNHPFQGIYAGLFWFPTFWGRDTFISLPGACLVLGRFELAREMMKSAAQYQKEGGNEVGRLPNLIVPGQVFYNTTDATHWFIRDVWELVRSTGDIGFLKEIFPVVRRAIEGALARRTDEAHLLTHGEAETWMDAGGESNPQSPRGNRAVEVEALWYNSLVSGAEMAALLGKSSLRTGWQERADSVKASFRAMFWDPSTRSLVDHLDPDGTRDTKKRPNQLLAVTVPFEPLLNPAEERGVMDFAKNFLLEPHGVLSLSRDDPDFHPYHIDWDLYHFDAAYHNGDVWLWLAGPMVELLVKNGEIETAWQITSHLTDVLLRKGAVGTLPELENGTYLAQEENLEGTITQAWSLAEYIRVFYQAYLGVRHDGLTKKIRFEPALPAELESVRFRSRSAEAVIEVEYAESAAERSYSFFSAEMDSPHQLELVVRIPGREPLRFSGELTGGERLTVFVRRDAQGEWQMLPSRYRVD
jgi:predicted glycogen debranching enzyme